MKTLILMRHGKAVGFGEGFVDYDRPLTFSGVSFVREQGEILSSLIGNIESILYSPAKRTKSTMESIAPFFPEARTRAVDRIYGARAPIIEDIIFEFPSFVQSLLIVGHNPGVSDLFSSYAKERFLFSPGSFGVVHFEVDEWSDILRTPAQSSRYQGSKSYREEL